MKTCANCKYSRENREADTFHCTVHGDDTPREYGENMYCDYHMYDKAKKEGAE